MKSILVNFNILAVVFLFPFVPVLTTHLAAQEKPIPLPHFKLHIPSSVRVVASTSTNVTSLLSNQAVQKELELDEKQTATFKEMFKKLHQVRIDGYAEARKSKGAGERSSKFREIGEEYQKQSAQLVIDLKDLLNQEQTLRLDQIILQSKGIQVLGVKEIADKLKMAEEQRLQVVQIQKDGQEKRKQLIADAQAGKIERRSLSEKLKELVLQTEADMLDILTQEQLSIFEEMKGDEIEFTKQQLQVAPEAIRPAIIRIR